MFARGQISYMGVCGNSGPRAALECEGGGSMHWKEGGQYSKDTTI